MSTARGHQSGQTLIEALAALVVVAVAAAIVAAAAMASLRAVHQAAALERIVAVAARELAELQSQGAPPGMADRPLAEPGLGNTSVHQVVTLTRDNLSELAVTVTTDRPVQDVTLRTCMVAGD